MIDRDEVLALVAKWRADSRRVAGGPMFDGASEYAIAGTYADCATELEALAAKAEAQGGEVSSKEAWWAGARAGLGVAADMPRSEVSELLATHPAPKPAEGEWVMMPRVLSRNMLTAMRVSDHWPSLLTEEANAIWAAAIAAAPKPAGVG